MIMNIPETSHQTMTHYDSHRGHTHRLKMSGWDGKVCRCGRVGWDGEEA